MKQLKKRKNLDGVRFGRLTAIKVSKPRYYLCQCDCGVEKTVRIDHLQTGKTTSCGCYRNEVTLAASTKHGHSHNPLYFVWASMIDRCYNPKFHDYHNYGGRGITVCDRWRNSVSNFIEDMEYGYAKGLQLDRVKNDEGYSQSNCRWVTRMVNNRNKRTNRFLTVNGETKTATEWAELSGISFPTIIGRMNRGLSGSDVINPEMYGKKGN